MPFFVLNTTRQTKDHRFSPRVIDTPAKRHRTRAAAIYTLFVLQKAAAQDTVNSQRMAIKPLHADTALIPAQGARGMKKEGWPRPTSANSWTVAIA